MYRDPSNGPDSATLADAMGKMRGKSESELMDALRDATASERAAGNLDNTRMDAIYEKLAPMLTESQKQKMQQVLSRLKE